ncbi:MAG TPA: hypothetical protein PLL69_02615 [Gemmatimonadales bacterium]|nr:hypothetical protein [Gemmatimonadales bacterium]
MRATMLVLMVLLGGAELIAAQSGGLPAGARVRWMEQQGWVEADVQQPASPGSPIRVVVRSGVASAADRHRIGKAEEIAWDADRLALRTRKGRQWRGAMTGAVAGALVGGMIGLVQGDDPPGTFLAFTGPEKAVLLGSTLGLLGGLIGAIAAPGAQWQPVVTTGVSRISWQIGGDGIGMKLNF